MATYIFLLIILLVLAVLIFSERKTTQTPKNNKTPEQRNLEAQKQADIQKRRQEEKQRAKEETERRIKAARETEARKQAEEEAKREAEAAEKKRREAALKEEAERQAQKEAEEQRLKAEKHAAEEEAKATEGKERISLQALPDYPAFDHSRLLKMGLSDAEAKEFIEELIPQIETQLPLIEKALQEEKPDFEQIEHLTHSIKGSSTNIGTGGVADLLVDYNTYLKTGDNPAQARVYLEGLAQQLEKLKAQYL